jgi:hypothetical protein
MIRNYTQAELDLQASSSRKYWDKYKAERESRRLDARRLIAAAILVEEMRRATDGRELS